MAETPKESPRAQDSDFIIAEQVRTVWRHHPAVGIKKEHLLEPGYWAIVSRKLTPGDKIECFAQDGTHYGEFLVLAADRVYAKVELLAWHSLTTAEVSQTQDFKLEYKGPKMKHCVIRASNGEVIHQGAQTKDEAANWLREHEKVLTA